MAKISIVVLSLFVSAFARAQELPELGIFLDQAREAAAPLEPAAKAVAVAKAPSAFESARTLAFVQRWPRKEYTYDLRDGKVVVARITGTADGYELRDSAGVLLAATHDTPFKNGRTIRVVDGAGAVIGVVTMGDRPWAGRKSFDVKDAEEKIVAQTGTVYYLEHPIRLNASNGATAALFEEKPSLFSKWTITLDPAGAVDRRVAVMILPYNEAADQ